MNTQLVVRVRGVDNARTYEAQVKNGTGGFQPAGIFTQTRQMILTGLTPGQPHGDVSPRGLPPSVPQPTAGVILSFRLFFEQQSNRRAITLAICSRFLTLCGHFSNDALKYIIGAGYHRRSTGCVSRRRNGNAARVAGFAVRAVVPDGSDFHRHVFPDDPPAEPAA